MKYLSLLLLLCGCSSLQHGDKPETIRVLVYNIHAGKDAKGIDNLFRVGALILENRADIALLQEVDRFTTRSGKIDQPDILKKLTGMHGAFGKTLDFQGGEYGIAVLSRWPIEFDSLHRLPVTPRQERSGGSYEPRGALQVVIRTPGEKLSVLNTHIDASREDFFRRQEMAALLALVARPAPGALGMPLLGGDLNAEPGSAVMDMLRGSAVRDPWPECGEGSGLSFPAHAPVKRIDYLLLPSGWRCVSAKVLETETSDHRPVLFVIARN